MVRGWFPVLGGLFLRVYCGLCGGKGIYGILKGKNARLFNLNLSCCVLYMNGGKLMVLPCWVKDGSPRFSGRIINVLILALPVFLVFFFFFECSLYNLPENYGLSL